MDITGLLKICQFLYPCLDHKVSKFFLDFVEKMFEMVKIAANGLI